MTTVSFNNVDYLLEVIGGINKATVVGPTPQTLSSSLTLESSITYNTELYIVTDISDNAFFENNNYYGALIIPGSITNIGVSAFQGCFNFDSLVIPYNVTTLNSLSFANCSGFTSVSFPISLTFIGDGAFESCTALTSFAIRTNTTSIGINAFNNCSNLTNVVVENQSNSVIDLTSFPNVSQNPNSTITFYLTAGFGNLTGNWSTTSAYFANQNYYSTANCFNEGTKILCLNKNLEEEYIPIENLKKGDLVKSYKHGYRRIELIGRSPVLNDPDNFRSCMYKMVKNETNELINDLIVTGLHSILVDDLNEYKKNYDKIFGGNSPTIDDKYLLFVSSSNDFIKIVNNNVYNCYHFVLENNGNDYERFGVWANGILTDTPSKKVFLDANYILL